ncbi:MULTISPECIES: type IV secretory system conjugative DNA transfer family protein [unclassified Tolypothrix]|uniref:type IV secretory system conjugative DNA transfer family protein n=1 Tax=unclassified Tolypothrix TaxID=2649714 RepID=UPI0005EAC545|nr:MULTISPECIES: type IV secretion system DNA-binding domain-containing protein [unclassified Tolypothrix]UYD30445.1 type IV secretory system conjugative DNA transfer family protein [Tolypothrix sp. PCC 7712]BAY95211.1 transfer complex protein TrsK-like protein [Microchaete diplosiphon NIES-3275]EKE98080.1 conjugation protein, putative TraG family [Tolypothrix sp. PCC 7601]MBE9085377.1 type IV secretory system conjugative DNA transfer family protein [Tolypothrix sp. LEGE 11397]UYD38421.1 type 
MKNSTSNYSLGIQVPLAKVETLQIERLTELMKSQSGLVLLSCLIALAIFRVLSGGNRKGKLATSYWGGGREKYLAARKAKQQISNPTRNWAALYIGTPQQMRSRIENEWRTAGLLKTKPTVNQKLHKLISPNSTLYVPDVQRGIAVIGAAGSGKTFSVIDPLIRSAFDQGFPVCAYDFKYPAQTKRAVAYAMKRGYTVRIFAPGFPESETCNPLDLLKDEEDAIAAGQITRVISRNFDRGGNSNSDKFFEEAGDSLVEGILLVTKAVKTLTGDDKYCDLMMAQAILSLPNLAVRLEAASRDKLKIWTTRPLSQLISVKYSEKTTASIVGAAQRIFQRFLKKDFVGAFCGQTTLPLDLDGKQLIVFGLNRNNRDIISPLLAAILHMIVTRNVSRIVPRKDPLVVALDELPTLYLPALVNWLNESREDGFVGILGYQNIVQLEKVYGKELTRAILGGTATKFIFNPQDPESAKLFSDYLGEMEIKFNSKSRSTGKGGASHSTNEQHQKRHLFEAAQFAKMSTGKAVIINPAYTRGTEAYVPILQTMKVPAADIAEMNWSEGKWDFVRERLIQNNSVQISDSERSQQFMERRELAEKLFPIPEESNSVPSPEEVANVF